MIECTHAKSISQLMTSKSVSKAFELISLLTDELLVNFNLVSTFLVNLLSKFSFSLS